MNRRGFLGLAVGVVLGWRGLAKPGQAGLKPIEKKPVSVVTEIEKKPVSYVYVRQYARRDGLEIETEGVCVLKEGDCLGKLKAVIPEIPKGFKRISWQYEINREGTFLSFKIIDADMRA